MKLTNKLGYPAAYVARVTKGMYKPKKESIGVTSLIDAPLVRHLLIKHWDDIVLDVDDFFKMSRGTAWHEYLESEIPEDVQGEVLERIPYSKNLKISGKIDIWDEKNGIIGDYKTCSPWAIVFGQDKKWEQQLNVYAWMKRKNKTKVNKLEAYVFLWDWSKLDAGRDKNYPQRQYFTQNLPLWTFEQQQAYIDERMEYHKDPQECTAEEKWQSNKITVAGESIIVTGPVYAVKKKDRKSALRVLPSKSKAIDYICKTNLTADYSSGKIFIETREGCCRRCEEYCSVRGVCPYAKK